MTGQIAPEKRLKMRSRPAIDNTEKHIKSTWRQQPRSTWTFYHWFFDVLNLHATDLGKPVPAHKISDRVPYLPYMPVQIWTLTHGFTPMVLHQLLVIWLGHPLALWHILLLYNISLALTGIRGQSVLRRLAHEIGFFDNKTGTRPEVPDCEAGLVFIGVNTLLVGRYSFVACLLYTPTVQPIVINWAWLLVKMALYTVSFDFWFYWWHRAVHELPYLRQYHRKHHIAHHPSSLLAGYMDYEQLIVDYLILPAWNIIILNGLGMSLSFYEWWICNLQCFSTDMAGHSGLRMYASPATLLYPILRSFGCEINLEDHDIHHRGGWKVSGNYGAHTRLWDTLLGTRKERIESRNENIDWNRPVRWPLV